jgi:hypothetical protein
MVHARIAFAAAVIILSAMAGSPAKAELFSGTIEGMVSIDIYYSGTTYLYPDDPRYQDYSYHGPGTFTYGFSLGLPINPDYGSIGNVGFIAVNDINFYSTPDARVFGYDGQYGPLNQLVNGYSDYQSKGYYHQYSFSLWDSTGMFFSTGVPVPGMIASVFGYMVSSVGEIDGTISRRIAVSFSGQVAPAPVPVPEPSGLVLAGIAGLCGLGLVAGRNSRDMA